MDSDPTGGNENVVQRYTTSGTLLDSVMTNPGFLSTIEIVQGSGPMVFATSRMGPRFV